jgi:2'-5' RNA ligase
VSPFPAQMEDHWCLEPGVDPGRARLMWFMLFGDDPQVAGLARLGQARLAGLPGLDLVPQEWLHMTTLIAGFADEIAPDQVDAMAGQARRLLARTRPVTITLGRVLYHPRAVMLDAQPSEALGPVLRAAQQATRITTGRGGELYHEPWTPHITLAYGNTARPAGPVIEALGRELPRRQVTISSISLVSQAPEQLWTWQLVADVPFGSELPFRAEDTCS